MYRRRAGNAAPAEMSGDPGKLSDQELQDIA
jgi:hypothetical protein